MSKYFNSNEIYSISIRNITLTIFLFLTGIILDLRIPPVEVWLNILLFKIGFSGFYRFLIREILINFRNNSKKLKRVAIYGAGSAGAQLALSLRFDINYKIITFIDDNPKLWNRSLNGISIRPFEFLNRRMPVRTILSRIRHRNSVCIFS